MAIAEQIIILIILLFLSAFFSGSEVALISLTRLKVRQMVEKKRLGASFVKKLKDNPHRMLSTILIGNNLVNVAASAIATSLMIGIFQNYAIGIATGIMTFLILVFGELTPKSIATQLNETISQIVAAPLWYLSVMLHPLIYVLDKFIKLLMSIIGIKVQKKEITEEEIMSMIKTAEEEGSIKEIEKEMINSIFEFDDINISEIATPRTDITMISSDSKITDVINIISKDKYSRIPVYKDHKDTIVGIIYLKDIIPYLKRRNGKVRVSKIMKKPYFVPETMKIGSLLRQLQKRKEQMAIVVDEHGSVTGVVTMEDVLEEIVGEILDETDRVDPPIRKIGKMTWVVNGKTDVDEINEKIHLRIKGEEYDTLSGFILHHIGRIPKEGEEIVYNNFNLKVEELKGHRISKVRIEKG
jgi:CBS domain containing-hemolysin-like protein